ncbi:CCR4-NOT transcription complex subunit 9-like [Babylonia areolata]|uniref:CCR4-NOT transcription complex subunit 9-like n=1 Tax=Babylonia areolata TaxID=304850 RepID=UPI003FD5DA86
MSRKRKTPGSALPPRRATVDKTRIENWVKDLGSSKTRAEAMNRLMYYRDLVPELPVLCMNQSAPILGLVEVLDKIVPAISPPANPPGISPEQSRMVCEALELLKLVAVHPDTRAHFLQQGLLKHVLPFLKSVDKSAPFQQLRQTSVGLVEALARTEQPEALEHLLDINIFDHMFSLMDTACDPCKTASTYVVQRLLAEGRGLRSICDRPLWLLKAVTSLELLVLKLASNRSPPAALMENMLRCYALLSGDPMGQQCIRRHLPVQMVNGKIRGLLEQGSVGERLYREIINSLKSPQVAGSSSV